MSQVEVPKIVEYVAVEPTVGHASVPKIVMYAWAMPGDSGPDTSNRQGHVHTQILRRS